MRFTCAILRFIGVWIPVNTEIALAVTPLSAGWPMLLRDFFCPSLVATSLVFALACAGGLIWEVIGLFVYI